MNSDKQSQQLEKLKESKKDVSVYLTNGVRLNGKIADHDAYTIFLDSNSTEQVVYKHAISTILIQK